MVVGRGGVPFPTRPLSPSAPRSESTRLNLEAAGRAREVVRRVKRRTIEVKNFIFAVDKRMNEWSWGLREEIWAN